jgi:general secretion pathway protein F
MPRFRYVAVEPSSATVEGLLEAVSRAAVVDRLRAAGSIPIRVDEVSRLSPAGIDLGNIFGARAVSPRTLALMTSQLATLLQAGLAIDEALSILIDLLEKPRDQACLRTLRDRVSGGATLSAAMAEQEKVFPDFYVSMIRAGEAGATLDTVLAGLAEFLERSRAAREHVKSALIYPLVVAATSCVSIGVLFVFVVPRFRPLFEQAGDALPLPARALLIVSDGLAKDWWIGCLVALVGAMLLRRQFKNPSSRRGWERRLLKLPLVGDILRKSEVVRFSRTLGTLLKNGVSLLPALTITRQTMSNLVFRDAVSTVIEKVTTGKGLSGPIAEAKIFPMIATHLIRVGEESGRQDDMLLKIADILEGDTRRSIDRMLALLTPTLTIVLGVIVAGVIGSILTAVLSVYDLAM